MGVYLAINMLTKHLILFILIPIILKINILNGRQVVIDPSLVEVTDEVKQAFQYLHSKTKATHSDGRRCGLQLAVFVYFNCPRRVHQDFKPDGKCQIRAEARKRLTDRKQWTYEKRESFDEETMGPNCNIYNECCKKSCDKSELDYQECF